MNTHEHEAAREGEEVLLHKTHPIGGAFVAVRSNGSVRAGYTEQGARIYDSAVEAITYFRKVYESIDHYGAGNICNVLENRPVK